MALLWYGGEDIDFPNGHTPSVVTTAGHYRAGYARCKIGWTSANQQIKSTVFQGGEVTSCWISFRSYWDTTAGRIKVGLGKSGTSKGLFLGPETTAGTKISVSTYDGTTRTQIAASVGLHLNASTLQKIDMQLVNYGVHAEIRVWVDGALAIEEPDIDCSISGVSGFDSVFLFSVASASNEGCSEIIVASHDIRARSLCTYYPNAAASDGGWTGTFTDIDEVTIDDADLIYSFTDAQDFQCGLTATPAGSFAVESVKVEDRAIRSVDEGQALGIKSGSTISVDGTPDTLTEAWATYEHYMATNPVTGNPFTVAEMDALLLNIRSVVP